MSDMVAWDELVDQYRLVYESAKRALEGQEANLDNLRARVGQLVAVAAIATSFLGGAAYHGGSLGPAGVGAVVLFAVVVALGLWIIYPRSGWHFRPAGSAIRDTYIEREGVPASVPEMYRGLANDLEDAQRLNQPLLDRRFLAFEAAIVLLAIEVTLWLIELFW